MATTTYAGIDYGMGMTNVDRATGIRYGVINQHSIMSEALNDMESVFPDPACPKCGQEVIHESEFTRGMSRWKHYREEFGSLLSSRCREYACKACRLVFDADDVCADEPIGMQYEGEGYKLTSCLDSDIMVLESPYYTRAQFCSPCVPGGGSLDSPCEDGPKTYCLGHEWFDDESPCPYPVYRVSDDRLIRAEVWSRLQRREETRRRLEWEARRAAAAA